MESVQPAHVVLQVVDKSMRPTDRDLAVQTFWDDLTQLELTDANDITPLRDPRQDNTLYGLDVRIPRPEELHIWWQDISDRLATNPATIRLTCTLNHLRVQIQTASPEEVLGFVPLVDMILPARQIYQARAETYASREGEFSPVEQENLELLCYQLNLDPEVAEYIKERALGPYRDRQTKLDKYREVLNAELDRQLLPMSDTDKAELQRQYATSGVSPLSATTQAELKRLYEALGLAQTDVAAIQEAEIKARLPVEEVAAADDAKAEAEAKTQEESAQQQAARQQNFAEQYRQEFAGAIARSLFPSEFDRGRLEQARRTWQLDRELVRAIERETTDERYGPIDSALGLDYSRLRYLLWLNQWDAADQETERLVLSGLSRDMRPLSEDAILHFNRYCVDVQTLDQLWSRHSQGKFGFAAQYQIYVQEERQVEDFLKAVAWVEGVGIGTANFQLRGKAYRHLQFNLQAPEGHLPTWRWAANSLEGDYALNTEIVQKIFYELIEKCLPHLKTVTPPAPPAAGVDEL